MTLDAIRAVLDRHAEAGGRVLVWWRDDDAIAASPALDRLLAIADRFGVGIGIATIPARLQGSLVARLAADPGAGHRLLVHGWQHTNWAGPGEKKAEFGSHRPLAELEADAARGLVRLRAVAGASALPVFVPPWNRADPALAGRLAGLGYQGFSAFGSPAGRHSDGLVQLDTHLDPVDWTGTRSLLPAWRLAAQVERSLMLDTGTLGLLTHHGAFDGPLWDFTTRLCDLLASHPAIRFVSPEAALRDAGTHLTNPPRSRALSASATVASESPR